MAKSLSKVQYHFRRKGQTTCIHHQNMKLELYCETCRELACTKCLSTLHKSHAMCSLSEITPQKKEAIRNFVDNTEKVDLVQIDQYITSTDAQLKENVSQFEKLSIELQTQTNKLKYDLDLLTARSLYLYKQMEEDNTKLLQTYKQDLEMYRTQLKQQVQECKEALQRGSDIQIYNTGCEIQSSATLPVKPFLGTMATAGFTPNKNPESHLAQALGEVYTSCQSQDQALQVDLSVGSSAEQGSFLTEQNSKGKEDTLLTKTKVLGEWWSPCCITSVPPSIDGQLWIRDNISNTLTLLDRKGKVIQEVKHNTRIIDISQSPTTNTLWVCDDDDNITELVSGQLVHRFSTSDSDSVSVSVCLCITASNNVIVGMVNNISKFTTRGKPVLTASATETRKTLLCYPYRITECPVTHNVAVADWDSKYCGGVGKCVVVMDTDFKKLFVYSGEIPSTYQPTSQSGCEPFNPSGVVYDSVGNLVIGDQDNSRILLFSGRGEFLRMIHTDDKWPSAVGIDREDVLWAVFMCYKVKQLQYRGQEMQCIIS